MSSWTKGATLCPVQGLSVPLAPRTPSWAEPGQVGRVICHIMRMNA